MSANGRRLSRLRPRPGRRLPQELRASNVAAIASVLPDGVRGPAFEELIQRIDEGPIHDGNRVEILVRGDDAFRSKKEAIQTARSEILLESYILRDDETGHDVLESLAAAAGRGVAVKVLADAFGSLTTGASYWREMKRRGIEVHLFHPFWPYPWFHFFRDHRKILAVDRRIAFVGGMNLGREYGSPRPQRARTWRDTDARIEGPAVRELALVFSEAWNRAGGSALEPAHAEESRTGSGARILVLESRPGRGHQESASVLAAIAAAARDYLWVTNAYFAPRALAIEALGRAVARGVDVRLLLPGKSDLPLVRHAGHGYFRDLLRRGVRIFEYHGAILHAKTLVADGFVSLVGSTNLDFRSFHFNAEVNVLVMDEVVAGRMAAVFCEDVGLAGEIQLETWNGRPWFHKVGDGAARHLYPLL
ncbi:MAG: phospholipase D-like domain-containing protein [Vicinamibacteria bacterium]